MSYRIFSLVSDYTACEYYRIVLPHTHLGSELASAGIEWTALNRYSEENRHDAYVFGRVPSPEEFMAALREYERGSRIIWDIDDDFLSIPDWSSAREAFGPVSIHYLEESLKLAHAITVSTRVLAQAVKAAWPFTETKLHILENLVDIYTYFSGGSSRTWDCQPLTKILWTGSKTHLGDSTRGNPGDIAPVWAVADYIQSHPGYLLIVYGPAPEEFHKMKNIVHIPFTSKRSYESVLSLISPDLALLPLADVPFNHSKSAIKFYECSMSGAMCLASGSTDGPFYPVISHERNGLLLSHDCPQDWTDAIRFWASQSGRQLMNENARSDVASLFSWNRDNERRRAWHDFYLSLAD